VLPQRSQHGVEPAFDDTRRPVGGVAQVLEGGARSHLHCRLVGRLREPHQWHLEPAPQQQPLRLTGLRVNGVGAEVAESEQRVSLDVDQWVVDEFRQKRDPTALAKRRAEHDPILTLSPANDL
jgi:hypothetical protein